MVKLKKKSLERYASAYCDINLLKLIKLSPPAGSIKTFFAISCKIIQSPPDVALGRLAWYRNRSKYRYTEYHDADLVMTDATLQ